MSLMRFVSQSDMLNKSELEKVRLLAYYHLKIDGATQFTPNDVASWFQNLHLARPNLSRLKQNMVKSPNFVKGSGANSFKLGAKELAKLDAEFPALVVSEEVVSHDTVLPASLFQVNRPYIESLGRQINASFENNIFDGCAVLMRRLLEILLIHAYEKFGIQSSIKDSNGNYYLLERIVNDATNNTALGLARNTKDCLEKFRTLGNFSAHKIYYNCKRQYIEEVIMDYRATIEELLYKAGLK